MFKIVTEEPPQLSGSHWSADLRSFIRTCLNKDSTFRPTIDELWNHSFVKKHSEHGAQGSCLAELVVCFLSFCSLSHSLSSLIFFLSISQEEYSKLLAQMGCNAAIRGEKTCDESQGESEGIIKVYMPDKTYRTILIKTSQTTTDVTQKLRKRMGPDDPIYTLYRHGTNEQEHIQLQPFDKPLLLVKDLPVGKAHFLLKEQPDATVSD
jgi:serine/threonine protein kinase